MPVPERIANAPQLDKGLELYYNAFMDLTVSRQLGPSGEGPIGWRTIAEYAEYHQLDEEQTEDMFHLIAIMDSAYLDYRAKKISSNLTKSKPQSRTKRK